MESMSRGMDIAAENTENDRSQSDLNRQLRAVLCSELGAPQASQEDSQEALSDLLWRVLIKYQKEPFYTVKGLEFTYYIKGNELFVDRKDKSITRASVNVALQKAIELNLVVSGPKKLTSFGASYLYPIFLKLGIIRG